MGLGAPELLILLIFGMLFVVPIACGVATLVSATGLPEPAFEAVGQSKTLWIVLPVVGIFACGVVAIVAAVIWFTSVKPKVTAAA